MSKTKLLLQQLHRIENQIQNLDSLSKGLENEVLDLLEEIEDKLGEDQQLDMMEITNRPTEEIVSEQAEKRLAAVGLIEIFSDGACEGNPGPGGWGTIVRSASDEQELSGGARHTTNNIMEMTGALKGIEQCEAGSKIRVTTDSQYLVKGMTQWLKGWKKKNWKKADGKPVLNQEVWKALDEAASKHEVEWQWVKGHAGHIENERCDELAREAAVRSR